MDWIIHLVLLLKKQLDWEQPQQVSLSDFFFSIIEQGI